MRLNNIIKIYVPGTKNATEKLTAQEIKKAVASVSVKLSRMFGGCTTEKVTGCYISDNCGLISEKITLVYAFCNSRQLRKNKKNVLDICKDLKTEYAQEAISLEINNSLYFI